MTVPHSEGYVGRELLKEGALYSDLSIMRSSLIKKFSSLKQIIEFWLVSHTF